MSLPNWEPLRKQMISIRLKFVLIELCLIYSCLMRYFNMIFFLIFRYFLFEMRNLIGHKHRHRRLYRHIAVIYLS